MAGKAREDRKVEESKDGRHQSCKYKYRWIVCN